MLWFKRNLFFALSLLVALGLFGYGCFYLYTNWNQSAEIQKQLEETDANLKKIYDAKSTFPTETNIAILRQQEVDLKSFVDSAVKAKRPLDYDPKISSANFKTLLDNSLAELNRQADRARIPVAQREFGFSNIKPLVSFAEGSVPVLAEQLAEIKLICGVLFRSEITSLDSLRREAISSDDSGAASSVDYHNIPKRTNDLTGEISSTYFVTFQGFSESLAAVLDNVQRSPHGMNVKLLSVLPGLQVRPGTGATGGPAPGPAAQTGIAPTRGQPGAPGGRPAAPQAAPRRLDTLADEKAFRVSMMIEIVKAAPAPATAAQ